MTSGNIEAIFPLTPVQDGILFHTLYSPESPLYFQQYTCIITGDLDLQRFTDAWEWVIGRHAPMRSLLAWQGREQPLQIVRRHAAPEWQHRDWTMLSKDEQEEQFDAFLASDRERGFALDVAPLMRFTTMALGERHTRFVWSHHHIIIDGWSMGIVLREVFHAYAALAAGLVPTLDPAPDYRSFVKWLKSQDWADSEAFWTEQLTGFSSPTSLGIDAAGASQWAERHASVRGRLDETSTAQLRNFARSSGVTLSAVVSAAWAYVLHRYSGDRDVVLGTTLAGRPPQLSGSMDMVGLFINTLPLRVEIDRSEAVTAWVGRVHADQIAMDAHQSTPLVDIQGWSDVDRGTPLFETLLVFENVPQAEDAPTGLQLDDIEYLQQSNYPVAVLVMPGRALELTLLYDADRFDSRVMARLANQMTTVMASMPGATTVDDLQLFPTTELSEIVETWNETAAPFPESATIHSLIEQAAAIDPEAIALIGEGEQVTYSTMIDRAGTIAHTLRRSGVQRGDRVAINVDRSPGTIIAALGTLLAGATYVPLDPILPPERIRTLLDDTKAISMITGPEASGPHESPPQLVVDAAGRIIGEGAADTDSGSRQELPTTTPDDVAYVLYTSGSTGTPKGVEVTHRNLVASTHARTSVYERPVETFLLLSPFIFDSSVAGIFSSLTQGGTLVLPQARMEQDVHHLADLIRTHGVTHTLALPTIWGLLLDHVDAAELETMQLVMVAGEACPPDLAVKHRRLLPDTVLANEYGPTEATVWCTVHLFSDEAASREPLETAPVTNVPGTGRVPIGRPIPNYQCYILDPAGTPTPVGVPGELLVGGAGVAKGYLDRPSQTEERFVTISVAGFPPMRLYRTGDLARYLPDGSIDLIGRSDDQVKIRGQRIELGEVTLTIEQHPAVEAAIATVDSSTRSPRLVGYVEASTETDTSDIQSFVATRLPDAMVPSVIVVLESLPRGPTGKIDRASLPPVEVSTKEADMSPTPPAGPIEEQLAEIWSEVLGRGQFGRTDNFFELGGDSISSIRVIARAHQVGLTITPKQFFDTPTLAGLARSLDVG